MFTTAEMMYCKNGNSKKFWIKMQINIDKKNYPRKGCRKIISPAVCMINLHQRMYGYPE